MMSQPSDRPDSDLPSVDEEIQDYFVPGFDIDEIPSLWGLKQKAPLLNAFTTLFRGEPTGVIVRLHVLSDLSIRPAETPFWDLSNLRRRFAYLTETAFDTVIRRLRGGGLISYDREGNRYAITPLGLQVNGAVSHFLRSYEEEGLGLLTGLLYAGEAMGSLSQEELAHLLNRLGQLEQELISAVESASEQAILKARERFKAVWKRIEQGTEIIRRISRNREMDRETHRLGQKIALFQSRLTRVTSIFQRAMNDIDRQRMHLGNSGVSTSDLNRYLMNRSADELAVFLEGAVGVPAQPIVLLTDLLADVAEYELIEREKEEKEAWRLPNLIYSEAEEGLLKEELPHLKGLIDDVTETEEASLPLKSVIPKESFEVSSYRLSMLSLAGGGSESKGEDLLTEWVRLPLRVEMEEGVEEVRAHGVWTVSKGEIKKERS